MGHRNKKTADFAHSFMHNPPTDKKAITDNTTNIIPGVNSFNTEQVEETRRVAFKNGKLVEIPSKFVSFGKPNPESNLDR